MFKQLNNNHNPTKCFTIAQINNIIFKLKIFIWSTIIVSTWTSVWLNVIPMVGGDIFEIWPPYLPHFSQHLNNTPTCSCNTIPVFGTFPLLFYSQQFTSFPLWGELVDSAVLKVGLEAWGLDTLGISEGGRTSGNGILFLLNTTKCIATLNSASDNAPSFVTSANCLKIKCIW